MSHVLKCTVLKPESEDFLDILAQNPKAGALDKLTEITWLTGRVHQKMLMEHEVRD